MTWQKPNGEESSARYSELSLIRHSIKAFSFIIFFYLVTFRERNRAKFRELHRARMLEGGFIKKL